MQFEAGKRPVGGEQLWAFLFLDDRMDLLLCSQTMPEDTIDHWRVAWLMLMEDANGRARCDTLLAEDFAGCAVKPEQLLTYIRVLFGLLTYLQTETSSCLSNRDIGAQGIADFLNQHISFRRSQGNEPGNIQMRIGVLNSRDRANQKPLHIESEIDPTWIESWLASFFKQSDPDGVQSAIEYYELLYKSVCLQADDFVLKSFVAFSRALARRLEEDRYQHYRRRLQEVYEVIVRHEDDLNVARLALRYILRQGTPGEKWRRLTLLIDQVQRRDENHTIADAAARGGEAGSHGATTGGDEQSRTTSKTEEHVAVLTGLIADHYMDKYNLPRAIAIWRLLLREGRLLDTLLVFIQKPGRIFGLYVFVFLCLLVPTSMRNDKLLFPLHLELPLSSIPLGMVFWIPTTRTLLILTELAFVLLFARPFLIILSVIWNLFFTRRLYYGQLFLPRLLGAIVVGLSALTLNDIPYKIAIRSPYLTFLLLFVVVYLLSYLYILIDVYQTIKFEPWSELTSDAEEKDNPTSVRRLLQWLKQRFYFQRPGHRPDEAERNGNKSMLTYASRIAAQVFLIGVVQSFLVTIFVSGLILQPGFEQEKIWTESFLGWIDLEFYGVSFVFVPTLVLLWTGMALFIGAFVQLLWQERGVMSPVRE